MDGALFHNNPIKIADREWKLLWPNGFSEYPDVVLSLGTGFRDPSSKAPVKKTVTEKLGIVSHGRSLMKMAKEHIADSLNCEKVWLDYVSLLPSNAPASRFVRFNIPMLDEPPALDDVAGMKMLQQHVRNQLSKDQDRVRKLSMQLLATSFYWETFRVQQFEHNEATASGRLIISPWVTHG